jgi:hypothetical protein
VSAARGKLAGVVAIFTNEHGQVIVTATDFEPDRPGGCKLREAQTWRAKDRIAMAVVAAYAAPDMARAIPYFDAKQIVDRLVRDHGCKITIIPIGHESAADG